MSSNNQEFNQFNSFELEIDYLVKRNFKIRGFELLDNLTFINYGNFLLSDWNQKLESLYRHFVNGIELALNFKCSDKFSTWQEKSFVLENTIRLQIDEIKSESVGLLFSGGRDSCLLAKLLIEGGKEVTAYHVTPFIHSRAKQIIHRHEIKKMSDLIGIHNLELVEFGAKPSEHIRTFHGMPFAQPASVGLSALFRRSSLPNQKIICFAQGADTLSNVMHTQLNFYNKSDSNNLIQVIQIILKMYTKTWPKTIRVVALLQLAKILAKSFSSIKKLTIYEVQNISRIVGMYLVHTPFDSQFVYQVAKNMNQKVFNPFHSFEVANLYFIPVVEEVVVTESKKIEIDFMLERLGIHNLNFSVFGFNTAFVDENLEICNVKTFRRQLLDFL